MATGWIKTLSAAPLRIASFGRAEQRALERHDPIAVRRAALGKQHHRVARRKPLGKFARLLARRPLALAVR